jgi:hypothetical protein
MTPHNLCRFNLFCNEGIVAILCKSSVNGSPFRSRQETITLVEYVYISIRFIIHRGGAPTFRKEVPHARRISTTIARRGK